MGKEAHFVIRTEQVGIETFLEEYDREVIRFFRDGYRIEIMNKLYKTILDALDHSRNTNFLGRITPTELLEFHYFRFIICTFAKCSIYVSRMVSIRECPKFHEVQSSDPTIQIHSARMLNLTNQTIH